MMAYVVRRCLYAIPLLIGINVLVFVLFFLINTPDDMARAHLGSKRSTPESIDRWKREHGLDLPMFLNRGWKRVASFEASNDPSPDQIELTRPGRYRLIVESVGGESVPERQVLFEAKSGTIEWIDGINSIAGETWQAESIRRAIRLFDIKENELDAQHPLILHARLTVNQKSGRHRLIVQYQDDLSVREALTETIFFKRSLKMLVFDYGKTDRGEDIASEILVRLIPSLCITVPALLVGAFFNIVLAMLLAIYRGTYVDSTGAVVCVVLMSISALFYIIGGQWLVGDIFKLVPISGFDVDHYSPRFMILPVAILVMAGLGATTRFYRTLFLEELSRDYVRTARAKGEPEWRVLFVHTLKNALIPILTGLVVQLPLLFLGSLLIEKFFSIPGMGAYVVEAIQAQDFATVQAMVSLGSLMYVFGLLMTDLSYTLVDPRVRLE